MGFANEYVLAGVSAFFMTLAGGACAMKIFPAIGLVDRPLEYGLSRKPIPYSGGLVIFTVFLISSALFVRMSVPVIGVLAAAGLLTLVSFLDDRFRIGPIPRLFVQLLAAAIVVVSGTGITVITNPFGGVITLGDFAAFATIFWLIGMPNVMNWIDGIDGLASGVSAIAFGVIFLLAVRPDFHVIDQTDTALMAVILAASSLAFVFYEFHPAKMLMGDTGTMFLGLMLGVLAIFSGGKIATAFLVMGFPILDAVFVVVRRLIRKKSPFSGDFTHLHHKFLDLGLSPRKALLVNYFLCAAFGSIALFGSSAQEKLVMIGGLVLTAAIVFGAVSVFDRR